VGQQIDQEKLKALTAVLAKDIKSDQVLGALSQQLLKLSVETALNADMGEHRDYKKHAHTAKEAATIEMTIPLNA
jgi:putative transposase